MVRVTMIALLVVVTSGCASSIKRQRVSDPVMRIAIDAESVDPGSHVRLQKSLVDSNAFIVVDRAAGFKAVDREQRLQHKTNRFGADEKYAQLGKLYGIGGIIVASSQCDVRVAYNRSNYYVCLENLSLIDVTTGETIAVSEKQVEVKGIPSPDWTEAVNDLIENYPKVFANGKNLHQTIEYSQTLQNYRAQIATQTQPAPTPTPSPVTEQDDTSLDNTDKDSDL